MSQVPPSPPRPEGTITSQPAATNTPQAALEQARRLARIYISRLDVATLRAGNWGSPLEHQFTYTQSEGFIPTPQALALLDIHHVAPTQAPMRADIFSFTVDTISGRAITYSVLAHVISAQSDYVAQNMRTDPTWRQLDLCRLRYHCAASGDAFIRYICTGNIVPGSLALRCANITLGLFLRAWKWVNAEAGALYDLLDSVDLNTMYAPALLQQFEIVRGLWYRCYGVIKKKDEEVNPQVEVAVQGVRLEESVGKVASVLACHLAARWEVYSTLFRGPHQLLPSTYMRNYQELKSVVLMINNSMIAGGHI